MSADNGIYVLETKDSFRVVYAHAIENLYYSRLNNKRESGEIVPVRALEIFGRARYTRDKEKALYIANKMDEYYKTEYGVRLISVKKSWRKVMVDGKKEAEMELEILRKMGENVSREEYNIEKLKSIIKY